MFSGRLLRVRSIQDYDPSYMGYHLNGINSRKRIISAAVGLGMPSINTKILGKHLVLLPANLDEQHNIASALSDIDSLISQLEVLIEKKEAIFKGTMQDLLSGKRLLPGFNDEWQNRTVKEVCQVKRGKRVTRAELNSHGKYPVFQNTNYPMGYYDIFPVCSLILLFPIPYRRECLQWLAALRKKES